MDDLLPAVRRLADRVTNPVQYMGGEFGVVRKDPATVKGRVALCYPDTYEIGSSHNGMQLLYQIVNDRDDLAAERVFVPWTDMADLMRVEGVPLFSLDTHRPVVGFDVLGITLQTELTYTNVLEVLDLSGIPLRAAERDMSHPVVIAGGHGTHSPEVMADFFDVMMPGDGEETLIPLLEKVIEHRRRGSAREDMLRDIATSFPWAYVPTLYDVTYEPDDGPLKAVTPRFDDVPATIKGAAVFDFSQVPMATRPVVPHARSVHDRISIEIMRGCTRGCRFCQAGMITRPMRYRTVECLVEAAEEAWRNTGYDEITLTSLSSGDYPWIEELLTAMSERFSPRRVNISLPSLRVTGELSRLPALTNNVRKSSLTFAPEVATDRLRKIINKDIKNADVISSATAAFEQGWDRIKLYYMIGIPGEREEDLKAVIDFADELSRLRQQVTGKGKAKVNVTVSTFVPKAFVPFQWDPMMSPETIRVKQRWMRGLNINKLVKLKFHDAEQSFLEGILSRGDRRLTNGLIEAHRRGARFDAWSEHFRLSRWIDALEATGLDAEDYALRERGEHETLPWDHLDVGPAKAFLWSERERARNLIATDYCIGKTCHVCGVPPSLCFAIKRDMGLLGSSKRGILAIDEDGVTKGVGGVDAQAERRLTVASPGLVREKRAARPDPGVGAPAERTDEGA